MIGFPKPERRSAVKKRTERKFALTRAQVREIVYRRADGHCERCHRAVTYDCWPWEDRRAQCNENPPKSRGGDPRNPDCCELLCRRCHYSGPSGAHAPSAARMRR